MSKGQSKYGFSLGTVTITKSEDHSNSPNDVELRAVHDAMVDQLDRGDPHLTFNVDDMRVEVEIFPYSVMQQAAERLGVNLGINR